ncbi:hypothetical protein [Shinella fusca]|uniref:Uncharacterized BrkB/YihY/UPF0761 family membrane protein n=1 Tax=Shinella fusca TaxID=544480 RepID=A0A7W8DTG8_9HYPH|nr:hypothetical protein [Shinella fusca]MBB5041944.1 uncharacterized BrkB/YihY/UPF0761 family membrane protein [Shinella fusca]
MTSKIDLRAIVQDHFATFKDEATGKFSALDFAVMVGFPIAVAVGSAVAGFHIPDGHVGTLISAFAIFGGLLFNVLVLIYSFSSGEEEPDPVREELVQQSFANISFAVMSSLLAVMLLVVLLFVGGIGQIIIEAVIYFVGLNFLLTMLMVLKRMHILLRGKFTR